MATRRGEIFATEENEIVRVKRASRTGTWVTVQVIGGPRDGARLHLPSGIPEGWAQYPS